MLSKGFRIPVSVIVAFCFMVQALPVFNATNSNENNTPLSPIKPVPLVTYDRASDYSTLVSWWTSLKNSYPGYISLIKANTLYGTGTIPKTSGGTYDYYVARVTNEALGLNKPECLIIGGTHGDEKPGPNCIYWFADWLMRTAFNPSDAGPLTGHCKWLLDNRELYFVVCQNPDGYDRGIREDANGYDLNREADFSYSVSGGGPPQAFGTVNGKTLVALVEHHQFRTACEYHTGFRTVMYPWSSAHQSVSATGPISGNTYGYAPPDFNWFDDLYNRIADYAGAWSAGGGAYTVGPSPETISYTSPGCYRDWGYAADQPHESSFVQHPPYPGTGIMWMNIELGPIHNPSPTMYGGDDNIGYGMEVRRELLQQIDMAQPNLDWQPGTVANNSNVAGGGNIDFNWYVNGSMVCDDTYIQWGTDPNPVQNSQYTTSERKDYFNKWTGGTGWDGASDGATSGTLWQESIIAPSTPGDYYFVAKAQVDQKYSAVIQSGTYGADSYLRLIKEQTKSGWSESIAGATDGTEKMSYHDWWYSPIIKVHVGPVVAPEHIQMPIIIVAFGLIIVAARYRHKNSYKLA
jgi:hypothetical protein